MKVIYYFTILLMSTLYSGIRQDVEKLLVDTYGSEATVDYYKIDIPTKLRLTIEKKVHQKFYRKNLHCWLISIDDSAKYVSILDNTIGKSMPITFLTTINNDSRVENVDIIKYREPYGGEIQHRTWLSQFIGRRTTSSFKVSKDIDAISGATISVHSVNKGVQKLLHIYPYIKGKIH